MKPTSIRWTDEQYAALLQLAALRRRSTGQNVTLIQLVREGAAMVCEREGVAWPVES